MLAGRMRLGEAVGYWVAQFTGGMAGALVLWGILSDSPTYSRAAVGLGADGFGHASMVHLGAVGAFGAEVVLSFIFVLVVLAASSRLGSPGFTGLAVGSALTAVHLVGIPLTGTSVNPARSLGPALIVGHTALSQIWVFLLAPVAGGALAAGLYRYLIVNDTPLTDQDAPTWSSVTKSGGPPEPPKEGRKWAIRGSWAQV